MLRKWICSAGSGLMITAVLSAAAPTAGADTGAVVSVRSVRYWAAGDHTRVVIDLDSDAEYEAVRITDPDRIYLDIANAKLSAGFPDRSAMVNDDYLKQIRAAENRSDVVRVVLRIAAVSDYRVSELQNPFRIVVDLHGLSGARSGISPSLPVTALSRDEMGPAAVPMRASPDGPVEQKSATPATAAEPGRAVAAPPADEPKLQTSPAATVAEVDAPPRAPGRASVHNVRYWAVGDNTRVVIDLDSKVPYMSDRIEGPDRIYFDISNARLSDDFASRSSVVGDALLKQVRVAENRADVVRVVLGISAVGDYLVSELDNPFRIVIDLHGQAGARLGTPPAPRAFGPRPDEAGPDAASDGSPHAGQGVEKAAEKAVSPDAGRNSPSADAAGPKPQQPAPGASQPGAAPPKDNDPISPVSTPDVVTMPPEVNPADGGSAGPPRKPKTDSNPQGRPLSINGSVATGFYRSYTRGGGNEDQNIRFVPAAAVFDINGFYMTPDLVDYWVQPELNAGPQASDAGFEGGNGIRLRVTTLRRVLPVTFRYSNVLMQDVYFGSLSQVSSYMRKNRNSDLGVTSSLKRKGLPTFTVDWGTTSVHSLSEIAAIPDYTSHSNHLNFDSTYQRSGWDLRGFANRQQQVSDLMVPAADGTGTSLLRQKVMQVQGSARRTFLRDSELYVDGGSQATDNLLLDRPIDLTTRYLNANLRLFQRRRWKTSLRAGYTSNIAGILLTRLAGGLAGNGSVAPDSSVLQAFRHDTSYLNLNGLTSVDLRHGFGLYGSVDRTAVLTSNDSGLSSSYLTTAGGATYVGTYRWGSLSGQYGHTYGIGSITGQTGRIDGQNYSFTVQPGKWDVLQVDFSVRGSDQRVRNELPANEHSFASEGSITLRLAAQFRARFGGGWQQSDFTNASTEFRTRGFTARAGIEHPRFHLEGTLNSNLGNSLETFSFGLGGIGVGSTLLGPMHLVNSDLRGATVTLHVIPVRRLELTALWTRSMQHLEGVVANDFEIIDAYLTYHFRKLQIGAGFFRSTQTYTSYLATYPETERGRVYIRIVRSIKFL